MINQLPASRTAEPVSTDLNIDGALSARTTLDRIKLFSGEYHAIADLCRIKRGCYEIKPREALCLSEIALGMSQNNLKFALEAAATLPSDMQHLAYMIIKTGSLEGIPPAERVPSIRSVYAIAENYVEWAGRKTKELGIKTR